MRDRELPSFLPMSDGRIADAPELTPPGELHLPRRGSLMVRDEGDKSAPAVVLLHGWTVTADLNFFLQYGPLAERYRVISFDHRGHGHGLRPIRPVRIVDLADDVVAVADALGINRVVAVGYSLGGAVAQVLARRNGERLHGLVLTATMPRFRASDLRIWPGIMSGLAAGTRLAPRRVVDRVFGNMLEKRTADLHPWGVEQLSRNHPRMLLETGASLFNFDSKSWLPTITTPTSIVVTNDDRKVPPRAQRQLADLIPDAMLHPVDGGHDASVASAATFNRGLLEAIDSVLARAGNGR